jgi:hypothetical protein
MLGTKSYAKVKKIIFSKPLYKAANSSRCNNKIIGNYTKEQKQLGTPVHKTDLMVKKLLKSRQLSKKVN